MRLREDERSRNRNFPRSFALNLVRSDGEPKSSRSRFQIPAGKDFRTQAVVIPQKAIATHCHGLPKMNNAHTPIRMCETLTQSRERCLS
jgi:hypothetical protein